jgi:hypothetical protein
MAGRRIFLAKLQEEMAGRKERRLCNRHITRHTPIKE